jgi:hypothetical protein
MPPLSRSNAERIRIFEVLIARNAGSAPRTWTGPPPSGSTAIATCASAPSLATSFANEALAAGSSAGVPRDATLCGSAAGRLPRAGDAPRRPASLPGGRRPPTVPDCGVDGARPERGATWETPVTLASRGAERESAYTRNTAPTRAKNIPAALSHRDHPHRRLGRRWVPVIHTRPNYPPRHRGGSQEGRNFRCYPAPRRPSRLLSFPRGLASGLRFRTQLPLLSRPASPVTTSQLLARSRVGITLWRRRIGVASWLSSHRAIGCWSSMTLLDGSSLCHSW